MSDVNLLIIDLAKQAGFNDDKYGLFWDDDANSEGVDLEKFTFKIIQYCSEFIEQDQGSGHELANRLKKQFGIDECGYIMNSEDYRRIVLGIENDPE